jgi:hypothetical protein
MPPSQQPGGRLVKAPTKHVRLGTNKRSREHTQKFATRETSVDEPTGESGAGSRGGGVSGFVHRASTTRSARYCQSCSSCSPMLFSQSICSSSASFRSAPRSSPGSRDCSGSTSPASPPPSSASRSDSTVHLLRGNNRYVVKEDSDPIETDSSPTTSRAVSIRMDTTGRSRPCSGSALSVPTRSSSIGGRRCSADNGTFPCRSRDSTALRRLRDL